MPQALPVLAYYAAGASAGYGYLAAFVTSLAVAEYTKDRARDKAREAAARAARDRTITVRSGVAPRRLVLGTARLAGPLMYGEFVGEDDEYLDSIVALTHGDAGELSEIVGVYFDDEYVAAADIVDGVPTTGKYSGLAVQAQRLTWQGAAALGATTVTLDNEPNDPDNVQAILEVGSGTASVAQYPLVVASVAGAVVTLSAPLAVDGIVYVTYSTDANPLVPMRVQWVLGSTTQATTTWAGVDTPKWTTDHRLRGVSYVRTLALVENEAFATGTPNTSVVARGTVGVYDPRTDETLTHTTNPALLAAWFRTLPRADGGMGVPSEWINWTSVGTAANVCDELLSVKKLDGTGYENVKRYECNTVLNLDLPPEDNLRVILDAMAGEFPFTAGEYRCFAGAFRAAALTLTDDDVAGDQPITFSGSSSADQAPPNVVSATIYSAAHNWVETGAPSVVNDTYVTADGQEEPLELDLPATTDLRQANYLMGVRLEQLRPAMVGSLTLKGVGADVALMDTLQVNLAGYEALAGKTFEVRRRTNHWNGNYTVDLREVKASTYALDAERFTAPTEIDTSGAAWRPLPVAITSVANAAILQGDGVVLARALVTWAEATQSMINPAGWIDVRYREPSGEWVYAPPVPGSNTTTYLSPLEVGKVLFIEARARNGLGVTSEWTGTDPFTVTADNEVPPDPLGFVYAIKPYQAVFSWTDPGNKIESELRVGATWAGAAFGWAGVATDYKLARPANGEYRVWLAHRRNGVYSAVPVYVDVTIDDSIDAGGGGDLVLEVSDAPLFRFADGTTHTTLDPDLTLTARLINLFGEAEWTATAYDAISGGSSLGAVTLTGTGNARVLTGAAFTAPGTLGSVRRVDVTASLQGASDTQSVYRYDPTVTEPFLYLSNPTTAVPTDEAGLYGDYSRAVTGAAVLDTGVDDTAAWTLSIEPDSGITSTINGGAGPVSGAATVSVAVSDSTLDDGVVLIRATKSGETDLTAPMRITKRKAQGVARLLYFAPREDIVLPVDAYGQVTSFSQAWTKAMVRLQDGLDATDQYTFSKVDVGVTSTLTGNRIDITGWVTLGELETATSASFNSASAGWERPQDVFFAGSHWVAVGQHNFATWSKVKISAADDFETWTDVDTGIAGKYYVGGYDQSQGALCLINTTGSSNATLRSLDGGQTWAAGGTLPVLNQWSGAGGGDGYILACAQSNTSGAVSTDGGVSFSSIVMPGTGCKPQLTGPLFLARASGDTQWRSSNAGVSWTQITGIPAPFATAKRFKGRVVATFLYISTTSVPYSEDEGVTWATATLANAETAPALLQIGEVLYLIGSSYLHYSLDGKTWQRGDATGTGATSVTPPSGGVEIGFLPQFNATSGIWIRKALLSLSATEAAVHVKAHKPGEDDLEAVLPVQLGAIVPPIRVSNIYPALGIVLAGADGVATNMAQAQFAVTVVESSLTVTSEYTWAWSTTYMTPATGTGATAALTSMDVAQDRGSILFTGTAPGRDNVVLQADIIKIKGETNSGLNIGAAYRVSSATNTFVEFGLTETGEVRRREGASGSWVRLGRWIDPEGAGVGTGKWVRFRLKGSIDGSSTMGGTFDTWLQLTSARSFSLQDVTSGSHLAEVLVDLADNNTGVGMLNSLVQMELVVP